MPTSRFAKCSPTARRETDRPTLELIARHFSLPSLNDIVHSLERADPADTFAATTLATIRTRSPTSLAISFREISAGLTLSMAECMRMEFRILNRMLEGKDFYEGIRAVIVDKGDTPKWDPPTLEAIDHAAIARYFAPLGERKLEL